MPNTPAPWRRDTPPPSSRTRFIIWIGLMAALAAGGWLLSRAFPEQSFSGYDQARMVYAFSLVAMVSSGVIFARQFHLRESLRNIALWAGIAAVLVLGYLYQDVFADIGARLHEQFLPAEPVSAGAHTVVLTEGEDGSYAAVGEVNGVRVRFLVDTGASDIVLSTDDAARIGVDTASLAFTRDTETANGAGHGAPYTVDSLVVGAIRLTKVDVSINQAPMRSSLLGMAFLRRLKSFEVRDHKLYLRW